MRRLKKYMLERDFFERPVITYRDQTGWHTLEILRAGERDKVAVFREHEFTYVLYWNKRSPLVGIEKYLGSEPRGNLRLESKEAIKKEFGKRGLKLPPVSMAKNLARYLVVTPTPFPSPEPETRTFEIHLEDLTDDARERYLSRVGDEPAYGPLAILEIDGEEEDDEKEA